MCFSPVASFTAGIGLSVVGCMTLQKVNRKVDIPFAAIPLLFSLQQISEGVVWLSFNTTTVQSVATFIYLLFSSVVWPILIPVSILLMEPRPWRRTALSVFVALGLVVGAYFLYYLFTETVHAEVLNKCITYISPHFSATFVLSPYTLATCASCLFSSHRYVRFVGIGAFVSALVANQLYAQNFISVWCFFAAILSAIIYFHFHTSNWLCSKTSIQQ